MTTQSSDNNKRISKNTLALYKNARHDDEGSVYLQIVSDVNFTSSCICEYVS